MKQIYNFEYKNPPVLNESMLRAELEKRNLRRQTALIAICGILSEFLMLILALVLVTYEPLLSALCTTYVIISVTGSVVLTILMHSKHNFLGQSVLS